MIRAARHALSGMRVTRYRNQLIIRLTLGSPRDFSRRYQSGHMDLESSRLATSRVSLPDVASAISAPS